MTSKNLLGGAAVVISTATAHAGILMTSGHWSAVYVPPSYNPAGCVVTSHRPNDGTMITIGVSGADDRLRIVFHKNGWHVPLRANAEVYISIDSHQWNMNGSFVPAGSDGTSIATFINKNYYRVFYNQLRSGNSLTVRFPSGDEQPWTYSLFGIGNLYPSWLACVRNVVPGFLNDVPRYRSTQPYYDMPNGNNNSTQPYTAPQSAPPSATQPF